MAGRRIYPDGMYVRKEYRMKRETDDKELEELEDAELAEVTGGLASPEGLIIVGGESGVGR